MVPAAAAVGAAVVEYCMGRGLSSRSPSSVNHHVCNKGINVIRATLDKWPWITRLVLTRIPATVSVSSLRVDRTQITETTDRQGCNNIITCRLCPPVETAAGVL